VFREIRARLWRWERTHPEWTPEEGADGRWDKIVASYAAIADEQFLLIDPLAPEDGAEAERFWRALDDDVQHHGPPGILLTIFWHTRSTPAILGRYPGSSVWVHETIADRFAERTPFTDTFRAGDKLPGGILAFETTRASREVVLWLPSHRALVVGDVLLGAGDGGARLCPPSWLHGTTADAVRTALRPVLDLPVELLLLTHGDAIESDARGALERALAE
jgi:glyoxylase-like metal-dependent hydrolase (beta-lactamase superfamily II)